MPVSTQGRLNVEINYSCQLKSTPSDGWNPVHVCLKQLGYKYLLLPIEVRGCFYAQEKKCLSAHSFVCFFVAFRYMFFYGSKGTLFDHKNRAALQKWSKKWPVNTDHSMFFFFFNLSFNKNRQSKTFGFFLFRAAAGPQRRGKSLRINFWTTTNQLSKRRKNGFFGLRNGQNGLHKWSKIDLKFWF